MDWILIKRSIWLGAIAAGVSLAGCGAPPEDRPARSAERPPASPGNATPTDRATAESAAQRTGDRSDRSDARSGAAAGDAALAAKVKSALVAEAGVTGLDIDVDTKARRVTLSGEVETPEHRQRALRAARSVDGVEGVVDRLAVKRG